MHLFNKDVWVPFWRQLEADIADTLQNQILNWLTVIGLILMLIEIKYRGINPADALTAFVSGYLLKQEVNKK